MENNGLILFIAGILILLVVYITYKFLGKNEETSGTVPDTSDDEFDTDWQWPVEERAAVIESVVSQKDEWLSEYNKAATDTSTVPKLPEATDEITFIDIPLDEYPIKVSIPGSTRKFKTKAKSSDAKVVITDKKRSKGKKSDVAKITPTKKQNGKSKKK